MTHLDAALDAMASLVLPSGERWGQVASSFQWRDARVVLDPSAAPYSSIWRSRGGSKTTDAAGYALCLITQQLPPASACFAVAVDREQSQLLLQSISDFCKATPWLTGRFVIESWKATDSTTGSVLTILASDSASSWGLRPRLVIADEVTAWRNTSGPRELWESLSSAVAKDETAKLVTISTPGDVFHWSKKHIYDFAAEDPMWNLLETVGKPP